MVCRRMSALITSHQGGYTNPRFGLLPGASIWDSAKIEILNPVHVHRWCNWNEFVKIFDGKDVISNLNLTINDGEFSRCLALLAAARQPYCALSPGWKASIAATSTLKSRTLPSPR